jgi:hypothetical protein
MEMNVEKTKVMRTSRQQSTIQSIKLSKTAGECGIFRLFGYTIKNDAR